MGNNPEGCMVLVCGGRDYDNRAKLSISLARLHKVYRFNTILHGGARGADTMAGHWAATHGLKEIIMRAEWAKYGPSAGVIRNQKMLDTYAPNLVVAFPGGRGTDDMVRRAKLIGLPVEVIQ